MDVKMIKIERNAKMETAIARCKANHPKVRRVDAETVTVYGSKGAAYTVKLAEPKPGLKLAACDCPAGRESKLCYHVPAALVAPVIMTGLAAQKPADERALAIEKIEKVWLRGPIRYDLGRWLMRRFGVLHLDMLPDRSVNQIAAAIR